jgi:hypothetical protein
MSVRIVLPLLLALSACTINSTTAPTPPAASSQAASTPSSYTVTKAAASGGLQKIDFLYSINPDCTSIGDATVHVVAQPSHGTLTTEHGQDFTSFAKDNQRYECNMKKSQGVLVYYQSNANFTGSDVAVIETVLASGNLRTITYNMTVR